MVLILGNVISFIGCTLMILIGFIKKKERILLAQSAQFSIQALSNLILGSMPGTISCVLGLVRILVFARVRVTVWLKLGFLALQAVLTFLWGASSFVEWIPFLAMVLYTWYLDTDNTVLFKWVNLFGVLLFAIHDWHYRNYVGVAFDLMTVASTLIGVLLLLREKKETARKMKT